MSKYSVQVKDKVSKDLKDPNIHVVDINTENLVIRYLLEKIKNTHEFPPKWSKFNFSPSSNVQDTFSLLGFFYPQVDKWGLNGTGDGNIEAFIFDKKYSVTAPTPSRALFLAVWNYTILRENGIEIEAKL